MRAFKKDIASGKTASKGKKSVVAEGDREDPRRGNLRYHVDLGRYSSKARAQQVARDLAKRGYRAVVTSAGGTTQVMVKNFPTRDAARQAAKTLGRALKIEPVVTASR